MALLVTGLTAALMSVLPSGDASPAADAADGSTAGDDRRVTDLAPPSQRVFMVTDSVGLGAAGALPRAFPPDWDVTVTGTPGRFVEQLQAAHVDPLVATGSTLLGHHAVVAGGYNYPYWDPARFDRSIDSMVNRLTAGGVEHVYWVTLREVKPEYVSRSGWNQIQPYSWYFPTVNDHLERALQRHPNLSLVDWAAFADRSGLTYDAIHLNPVGAAEYSRLIAEAVAKASGRPADGTVTRVRVADPGTEGAVALTLTATAGRSSGYFTAFPCDGPRPTASNLNHGRDHTVAAAAIVPIGSSGEVCIYGHRSAHVIVDTSGVFGDAADLTSRDGTPAPARLVDTRRGLGRRQPAGSALRVDVTDGSDADTVDLVALNVTAVGGSVAGHVSAHGCDEPKPDTSNLNFVPGRATPNLVVAEPDESGHVCLTASADTHLVVDRFATFGDAGTTRLVPTRRVVDTRTTPGAPVDGEVVRFTPAEAGLDRFGSGAVIANLTIAGPRTSGFATVYPCASGRPATSNINYGAGRNIANLVIAEPDPDGWLCVYTHRAAEVIVDVIGATGEGFAGTVPRRLHDSRR